MSQYLETIDQPDSLRKPFVGSLVLHGGLVGMALLYSAVHLHKPSDWGSPNPGGGAIGINVVKSIPLPARPGLVNPLANNSQTTVPLPPPTPKAKPQPKVKAPEPDAIQIPRKNALKKPSERAAARPTYRAPGSDRPNQLYSDTGPAMVSPLIGQMGSGGIGIGQGSTLGTRFGWYIDLIRTKVGQHWNPDQQSSHPAIVTFTLLKDGSVRDVRVSQTSGNTIMDFACQRAILDSAPFQPLPDGAGNSASIEFWFNVRR
jgi:TonB family protein